MPNKGRHPTPETRENMGASFAVVTPSRGLVHSRTVEAVMRNVGKATARGYEFRGWFFTHDLPIPRCHERATQKALANGADALWYVEEDVIPPDGALVRLFALQARAAIGAVDYPCDGPPFISYVPHDPIDGSVPWAPLGCTLVARAVFEKVARPWFRTDRRFVTRDGSPHVIPGRVDEYGGQDAYFFIRARLAGFEILRVPNMVAGHARLRSLGTANENNGAHVIDVFDRLDTVGYGMVGYTRWLADAGIRSTAELWRRCPRADWMLTVLCASRMEPYDRERLGAVLFRWVNRAQASFLDAIGAGALALARDPSSAQVAGMLSELSAGIAALGSVRDAASAARLGRFAGQHIEAWAAHSEAKLYTVIAAMLAAIGAAGRAAAAFARSPQMLIAGYLVIAATDGYSPDASLWLDADLERERARQADDLRELWPDWPGLTANTRSESPPLGSPRTGDS
jgi:hypothetical protein